MSQTISTQWLLPLNKHASPLRISLMDGRVPTGRYSKILNWFSRFRISAAQVNFRIAVKACILSEGNSPCHMIFTALQGARYFFWNSLLVLLVNFPIRRCGNTSDWLNEYFAIRRYYHGLSDRAHGLHAEDLQVGKTPIWEFGWPLSASVDWLDESMVWLRAQS